MKKIIANKTYLFYGLLLLAACASLVVTNLSYDAEYQLAMAYRLLKGDALITEMWEPHQTSAFLCAIIMKVFMAVTGSTTGIVLFIHVIGLLIRFLISVYFCKIISKVTGYIPGLIAGIMYLIISPKDLLVPEFSNMQNWFSTLMFLTLVHYLMNRKAWLLVCSAVCLCLGVFSYPSFLIAYFAVFILLLCHSERKWRDILLYTGVCAGIGGAFVGHLLWITGWSAILDCLPIALAIEPSHTVNFSEKLWINAVGIAKIAGILAAVGIAGFAVQWIYGLAVKKQTRANKITEGIFAAWYILLALLLADILKAENHGGTSYPFLVLMGLGIWKRKLLSPREKMVYDSALWTGVINLLSTFLLSDHGILQAVPYMIVTICASTIPLYRWWKDCEENGFVRKWFLIGVHAFLLIIIFRSMYIHVPISGRAQICSITSDLGLIRSGPARGIITDEAGAAMQRDSMAEWEQYIKPGDTIWILGEPVDTLGYLYEDVEVGAPSVMSTPTYNQELLYYWELNPDKYPDVVILSSGFGNLSWELLRNEWLMNWLEEEYQAKTVIDGNFWRYYFKE